MEKSNYIIMIKNTLHSFLNGTFGLVVAFIIASCSQPDILVSNRQFQAEIVRTNYSIPHIKGASYGDVGFGLGVAFSEDNFCTLMNEVLKVRGQASMYFGDISNYKESDFLFKYLDLHKSAQVAWPTLDVESRELVKGYVSGVNYYRANMRGDSICKSIEGMSEVDTNDILALIQSLAIEKGTVLLQKQIHEASEVAEASSEELNSMSQVIKSFPEINYESLGSNAWAFGQNQLEGLQSILLANPHFPWHGGKRFYMSHLKVPGELNVMGGSILGMPAIQIGFNEKIAWTHTVSKAVTSLVYKLDLHPESKLRYRAEGGEYVDMDVKEIAISVKTESGEIEVHKKKYYSTHFGPVISDMSRGMGWNNKTAFTLFDANRSNTRMVDQWLRVNKSSSIEEIKSAASDLNSFGWVNTIVADNKGSVYYSDTSRVPNIDNETLNDCWAFPGAERMLRSSRVAILTAEKKGCDVTENGSIHEETFVSYEARPQLLTKDHIANSNDSHWLTNLDVRLEGFSPLFGEERGELSLRSRQGFKMLKEMLSNEKAITVDAVIDKVFENSIYTYEHYIDIVLDVCLSEITENDLHKICKNLKKWDGSANLDSIGVVFFREFIMALKKESSRGVYVGDFDFEKPIDTPNGIVTDREVIKNSIYQAHKFLKSNNIDATKPLRDLQRYNIGDTWVPVPGGFGQVGAFNTIDGWADENGYNVAYGTSFFMVLKFVGGKPSAKGLLTYSQSSLEGASNSVDQTELYANGGVFEFPFQEDEIKSNRVSSYTVGLDMNN